MKKVIGFFLSLVLLCSLAVPAMAAALPEITDEALPDGKVGQPYYMRLDCTDPDVVFSLASSSLPDGLYLTQHGEIEGTPTKAGYWQVVIRVTPEAGEDHANIKEFELTITEPAAATLPEITDEALPDGKVGQSYYLRLDCTDPDVVFSLASSSLPDGLYLTQHGEIEGTPTKAGCWQVVIRVTPEAGEDYASLKEFEMTITEPAAVVLPEITDETLPDGKVGQPYYMRLDCTDPDVVFSLFRSSLPDGLYLTQHGEIEGTPTKAGFWHVVIMVTPEGGEDYANTKAFEMTIAEEDGGYTAPTTDPDTTDKPTDPDTGSKPDSGTDSSDPTTDPTDKTDGQTDKGMPGWSIPVIAVVAAGAGVGVTLVVLKKKKA